ncbi:alpha/beta fold hydrolase [Pseudonocardia pini]|uniref:alpha/beta fold hydrolase n=1 Tax=Pseudonocardia pini TaxID=2758030 RepID=UPI0015F0DB04|nr:alpha/beta hydrolase [Pseudonocardia pini]
MTLRRVEVEPGVCVAVREVGDGDPVLLIHGWTLSLEAWDRQIRVLADAGHHVLAMDLRGHGRSDAPFRGYGIDRLAADAAAVLRARTHEPAAVVGWSLGGMTALRLAADFPDLVGRLVLVGSAGVAGARQSGFSFGPPPGVVESAMHRGEHGDRVGFRRQSLIDTFGSAPAPHLVDWLLAISLQTPSWAANECMTTLLRSEQVDALDGLAVPLTQIAGLKDPFSPVEGARWVHERTEGVLVELECGHYPMFECPDEFDVVLQKAVSA